MVRSIERGELRGLMASGAVTVVDALPEPPYRRRHLPGAVNLVIDDVPERAAELLPDRDATVVTYSTDEHCDRGPALAAELERQGWRDVRIYRAGIEDWVQSGLPVDAG